MGDWWHDTFGYPAPRNKKKYSDDERRITPEDSDPLYEWYEDKLSDTHGSERAFWENMPFYGQVHWWRAKLKSAQDSYDNTGIDDYYGDKYNFGGLLPLLQGLGSSAGFRPRRMSHTLSDMYDAEVEEDLTWEKWSKYDPETGRMHEYGTTHKKRHR